LSTSRSGDGEITGEQHDESHYDLVSSTTIGASATVLALISTLGTTNPNLSGTEDAKILLFLDVGLLLLTLFLGSYTLVNRKGTSKRSWAIITFLFFLGSLVVLAVISMLALIS
jgi:hypothetical protein